MSFDETIVHCSAPALCGIKPASLFSMRGDCFLGGKQKLHEWQSDFVKFRRYFVPIRKDDGRVLFFVFDRNLLEKICSDGENLRYLRGKGYPVDDGFNRILGELLFRLCHFPDFPHEVGVFLGYPLVDVLGFEKNRFGFKYSALWKVYGNKDEAERKMKMYKSCSETCMKWLDEGLSVPVVAEKYSKQKRGA
ncbi:MAG: DUF3793 family protein [Treponema sp.]|nr:DUF3793 family protein [Treponema sp.]